MKLVDALVLAEAGYSIRNADHGFQNLVPGLLDANGDRQFTLSGSLSPPHNFSSLDRRREDWVAVGYNPENGVPIPEISTNPVLEAQFGEVSSEDTPPIYGEPASEGENT